MALKPAGKAMIIGVVVAAIAGGLIMSGALDKLGSIQAGPDQR
jgi:hypothetical protein